MSRLERRHVFAGADRDVFLVDRATDFAHGDQPRQPIDPPATARTLTPRMSDERKKGPIILGALGSKQGALVGISSIEDLTRVKVEIARVQMRRSGIQITPELEAELERVRAANQVAIETEYRERGVAACVKLLLAADSKRDLERVAAQTTVSIRDLHSLLFNHDQMGLAHEAKHRQFVPEHLRLDRLMSRILPEKIGGPMPEGAKKALKQVDQLYIERRHVSAHMLWNDSEWHCIYLSYADAFRLPWESRNHWKHGTHVHFVSHLWPNLKREEVWAAFEQRQLRLPSIHIRFEDNLDDEQQP